MAIGPAGPPGGSAVVRLPKREARFADFAPDTSGWLDFLFTPDEEKVYSLGQRSADYSVDAVTFASPGKVTNRIVPPYTTLLRFSDGCPVMYAAGRGAWRSCGGLDDTPIAGGPPDQNVFGPRERGALERWNSDWPSPGIPGAGRHVVAAAARSDAAW